MYLKKFTEKRQLTVLYNRKGLLHTYRGRVCSLNLKEQTLSLKDDQQKIHNLHWSEIQEID